MLAKLMRRMIKPKLPAKTDHFCLRTSWRSIHNRQTSESIETVRSRMGRLRKLSYEMTHPIAFMTREMNCRLRRMIKPTKKCLEGYEPDRFFCLNIGTKDRTKASIVVMKYTTAAGKSVIIEFKWFISKV